MSEPWDLTDSEHEDRSLFVDLCKGRIAQLEAELAAARSEIERLRAENNSLRGLHEVRCTRGDGVEETMTISYSCSECQRLQMDLRSIRQQQREDFDRAEKLSAELIETKEDNRRHKDAVLALTKRCEEARKIIESLKELDYQTAGTPNYVLEEWLEGKP